MQTHVGKIPSLPLAKFKAEPSTNKNEYISMNATIMLTTRELNTSRMTPQIAHQQEVDSQQPYFNFLLVIKVFTRNHFKTYLDQVIPRSLIFKVTRFDRHG
jgi:hypothetical protein